jgi:hypothetical protein
MLLITLLFHSIHKRRDSLDCDAIYCNYCRDSLDCDAIYCNYCRGAMVFQLASMEGPNKAWGYAFEGQVYDSSTPKQVHMCERSSVSLSCRGVSLLFFLQKGI